MHVVAKFILGTFSLVSISCAGSTEARDDPSCGGRVYAEEIKEASRSVRKAEPLRMPADMFSGGVRAACALLEFDTDESGKPKNIRVLKVFPSRVYSEEAVRTLTKYEFVPVARRGLKIMFSSSVD